MLQVRDAFALAKEKAPAIIFIDEIDAIGTKRFDSELSGDREVQRTMLELLNQLDGFGSEESIKVRGCIAAGCSSCEDGACGCDVPVEDVMSHPEKDGTCCCLASVLSHMCICA